MKPSSAGKRETCISANGSAGLPELAGRIKPQSWGSWSAAANFAPSWYRIAAGGHCKNTDALLSYEGLATDYAHKVVNHAAQYVDGRVHTNSLENFWSLLKRGVSGTYVSVEPFHLFRYLDEQMFRFNNRKELNDAGRFDLAVSQIVGKRLTFAELTGKVGVPPRLTNPYRWKRGKRAKS